MAAVQSGCASLSKCLRVTSTCEVRVHGFTLGAKVVQRLHAEPDDAPELPLLPSGVAYRHAIAQLVKVKPTLPRLAPVLSGCDEFG